MRGIATDSTPPQPTASPPVSAGDLIAGRYRLVSRLARGGMAEVWEAVDDVLTRPVAVKILLPHLADDAAFVQRFRREAIAAARLSDPHIVSIYDTCSSDGTEAIVMELVRGSTLRHVLDEKGALTTRQAVDIARQVAAALSHAHRNGLVHRDVKPGNILLAHDGRVLVTDFGIAKAAETTTDLTEAGQVVGTAKYLSPEQVRGHAVDARSDVYGLGVVLYEMLCGRPPFLAENNTATAVARLTSEPLRPRQLRSAVPRQLEEVVLCALAREPDERYQTAAELADTLGRLDLRRSADDTSDVTELVGVMVDDRDPTPVPAPTSPAEVEVAQAGARTRRSWLAPLLLVLVVVGTLAAVGFLLDRVGDDDPTDPDTTPATIEPIAGTEPVPIVEARSFDPAGDGGEHDSDLGHMLDADAGTAWRTERYNDRNLVPFKGGVGVVLVLDGPRPLHQLVVSSPTRGWTAQVHVGDGSATSIEGWGEPVAVVSGNGSDAVVDLGGREGAAVLLWITDLGDGSVGPRFSTRFTGVSLTG